MFLRSRVLAATVALVFGFTGADGLANSVTESQQASIVATNSASSLAIFVPLDLSLISSFDALAAAAPASVAVAAEPPTAPEVAAAPVTEPEPLVVPAPQTVPIVGVAPPAPVFVAAPPVPAICPAGYFCYPRVGIVGQIVPYNDCDARTDVGTAIRSLTCVSPRYLAAHAYTQFGRITGWHAGDVVVANGVRYILYDAFTQRSCDVPARPLAPLSLQTSLTSTNCGMVLVVQGRPE